MFCILFHSHSPKNVSYTWAILLTILTRWWVYDINRTCTYELQIKNRCVLKWSLLLQLQIKPRKIWGFNGIWTHDPCDTGGAMLYQLSYEASSKQVKHEFNLYPLLKIVRWCAYAINHISQIFFLGFLYNCLSCFTTVKIAFTSNLDKYKNWIIRWSWIS